MEVLILSKTHLGTAACVGGIVLKTKQYVRLMNGPNLYQPGDTPFEVGQIWDINFRANPGMPPHNEDVIIIDKTYSKDIDDLESYIKTNLNIYKGKPEKIFDGLLGWTGSGSGYLNNPKNLPENSVGFWISDRDLTLEDDGYYIYKRKRIWKNRQFKYVGYPNKISVIPKGTLIRVSVARWWSPTSTNMEKRCYLQLSGWY